MTRSKHATSRRNKAGRLARSFGRLGLMVALFPVGGFSQAPTDLPPQTLSATEAEASAALSPTREVRLRKLHLVRPDLIPYPLSFEIYC